MRGEDGDVEGVVLRLELGLERARGGGEGRGQFTFLPMTPMQAIDGIAILLCGFRIGAWHSGMLLVLKCCVTGGGGMRQNER